MIAGILTIVIFLFMITLHEFGHFIVSKLVGVKVLEFAVGMGPALWKKQKGETLYSLRAFPVGGYCKLDGEDEANDDPRAFCNQKLWKRFAVAAAGATFNLILGFLVFLLVVPMQSPSKTIAVPIVGAIDERAYISESGIQEGDRIIRVNGQKIVYFQDISAALSSAEQEVEVTVRRGSETLDFTIKPSLQKTKQQYQEDGVWITDEINGTEKKSFLSYSEEMRAHAADYIGKEQTSERYILGFTAKQEPLGVKNTVSQAWYYTGYVVKMVYQALWDLVRGNSGIDQLSGPVGVVSAVDTAVKSDYGTLNVLFLIGMLTINLGVFNLLPLPALDGGRIFFMLIELIRKKPVPAEKEGIVHMIGLMLLLGFAVVVFFNDIFKLIG